MDLKKIITILCVSLFVGVLAFIGVWSVINFEDLKLAISGTQIYTREDVDNAYQDGYDKALENKTDYDVLLSDYREQISILTDEVSKLKYDLSVAEDSISSKLELIDSLNVQLTTKQNEINSLRNENSLNLVKISELEIDVAYLSSQIETLDKEVSLLRKQKNDYLESINYYKNFIDALETETSAYVTFIYNGKVVHMESISKGTCASYTPPTDTDYIQFDCWMVGETCVDDLSSYPIYTNTTFVAKLSISYEVEYYVEDSLYDTKIVLDGYSLPVINNPIKSGYSFLGWSIDGVSLVDEFYVVKNDIKLYAMFDALTWNVSYVDDSQVVNVEEVKTDNTPIGYTLSSTDRKVFKGWSIDGVNVIDVTTQIITQDVTFIAVYDYYYSVNYVVNGVTEKSVLMLEDSYISSYTPKSNENYKFLGWTLNGSDIVDVSTIQVTEDMELFAKIKIVKFTVSFNNDTATNLQTVLNHQVSPVNSFYSYRYDYDFSQYSIDDLSFSLNYNMLDDSGNVRYSVNTSSFEKDDYDIYRHNEYPISNTSTHYDISIEIYNGYVKFSVMFYGTVLDHYKMDFNVTLSFNVGV